MLEQVEEHVRLQQFAQVGRAHQACDRAVLPASGALRNPAYSRLCSRGVFMRKVHFVSFNLGEGIRSSRTALNQQDVLHLWFFFLFVLVLHNSYMHYLFKKIYWMVSKARFKTL